MSKTLEKLDKIESVLSEQAVTLAKLTVTVEDHVRRTNLLEEDMKPIKRHVVMIEGVLKALGVLAIIATIVGGASELLMVIFK